MENVQTLNDTKYNTPSQETHRMASQGRFMNKSILWQNELMQLNISDATY